MSNAIPGPGFLLQKGDSATPTNYTTVAECHDLSGVPAASVDTHEVTNQSSPGGYEEFVPTIRRSGEVAFDVNYDPGNPTHDEVTGLEADMNAKTLRHWRVIIPGTTKKRTFDGYVVGFSVNAPINGVLTAAVKIKITGQPGFTNP